MPSLCLFVYLHKVYNSGKEIGNNYPLETGMFCQGVMKMMGVLTGKCTKHTKKDGKRLEQICDFCVLNIYSWLMYYKCNNPMGYESKNGGTLL